MTGGPSSELAPAEERAWLRCRRCAGLRRSGLGLCAEHEPEREAEEEYRALTRAMETIREAVRAVHQEILGTPAQVDVPGRHLQGRSAA